MQKKSKGILVVGAVLVLGFTITAAMRAHALTLPATGSARNPGAPVVTTTSGVNLGVTVPSSPMGASAGQPVPNFAVVSSPVWAYGTSTSSLQMMNDVVLHGLVDGHGGLTNTATVQPTAPLLPDLVVDSIQLSGSGVNGNNVTSRSWPTYTATVRNIGTASAGPVPVRLFVGSFGSLYTNPEAYPDYETAIEASPYTTNTLAVGASQTFSWTGETFAPPSTTFRGRVCANFDRHAAPTVIESNNSLESNCSYLDFSIVAMQTTSTKMFAKIKDAIQSLFKPLLQIAHAQSLPTVNNVVLTLLANYQISVTWTDLSFEDHYLIYRYDPYVGYQPATPSSTASGSNISRITDTGTLPGLTYTYRVDGVNSSGALVAQSATVTGVTTARLPAPTASNIQTNQITVNWTDVSFENYYKIYRRTGSTGYFFQVGETAAGANTISFTDTTVLPGQSYTYRLHVGLTTGFQFESGPSNDLTVTSATPVAPPPPPPAPVGIYDNFTVAGGNSQAGNLTASGIIQAGQATLTNQITGDLHVTGALTNASTGPLGGGSNPLTIGTTSNPTGMNVSGPLTATQIGHFTYRTASTTTTILDTIWHSSTAACNAGETLISCRPNFTSTLSSGTTDVDSFVTISGLTCTAYARTSTLLAISFYAAAECFTPQ